MAEITITYETLYDLLRKEKNSAEIQELDSLFHNNLIKYIKEKIEILRSQETKDSIFTSLEVQKTRKQIDNIKKIIKELYEKRESKIVQLALMSSRFQTISNDKKFMLDREKDLYDAVTKTLNKCREDLLHNIILGNNIKKQEPKDLKKDEEPKILTKKVKFRQKTERFIGTDLNNYGPFEKEDTSELPLDIANLLINKQQVEEIQNENT